MPPSAKACATALICVLAPSLALGQGTFVIDSEIGSYGPVAVGLSEAELIRVPYPVHRSSVIMEGDEYTLYEVRLSGAEVLSCLLDLDGVVSSITTASPSIRDAHGLGVGSTLAELRATYADGRFIHGRAEDLYSRYLTGTRLVFDFEPASLDPDCFAYKPCALDPALSATSVTMYDLALD